MKRTWAASEELAGRHPLVLFVAPDHLFDCEEAHALGERALDLRAIRRRTSIHETKISRYLPDRCRWPDSNWRRTMQTHVDPAIVTAAATVTAVFG